MKTVACIIARTNSKRLPQKILKPLMGKTIIEYIITKIKKIKKIDSIYICTSTEPEDKILLDIAKKNNIKGYAGSLESVIDRMLAVAEIEKADNLVRITGDNVFTDEIFIKAMLAYHNEYKPDYTRTENLAIGVTAEIITVDALKKCYQLMDPNFSEYLYLYMFQPNIFNCLSVFPEKEFQRINWNLSVDTEKDYERTLQILSFSNKETLNYLDILEICDNNKINNLEFLPSAQVKLPGGITISYEAFCKEKEIRLNQAMLMSFTKENYIYFLNYE